MISVRGVTRAAVVAATVLLVLLAAGAVQADISIDTVPVGNPGNTADAHGAGYGAVAYTYNIGKYEVTAGQYTAFLNAVAKTDTYGLYNTNMSSTSSGSGIARSGGGTVGNPYTYTVDANFVNRPVNYVSFWDACRFANWLHNGQGNGSTETGAYTLTSDGITNNTITRNTGAQWAITSEDEWYKAAYHDKTAGLAATYFDYPTSSNIVPSHHLLTPDPGNNANFQIADGDYTIGAPYWRTPVGEFENSESPYGTYDQGGNVWEWNEAILSGSYRGDRGGSFVHEDDGMLAAYRHYNLPAAEVNTLGFRVSEVLEPGPWTPPPPVPEPVSLASGAIGLACVGALIRRRRRTR